MLMNSTKVLLANTMMIGVIMTISTNNWISMWMGLEMSLLSFIPFMQSEKVNSPESMIKYFIIQSVASTMFLLSVVIMLIGVNMMNEIMMTLAILIKLGSAPFHNWVLLIIETMNYYTTFIMLTVLKIPPLTIMYQINTKMLTVPIIMGMVMSALLCLNQSSMRKILGYSSIYSMSLLLCTVNSYNILIIYVILYSISLILLISIINSMKINFINQMVINEHNPFIKINLWINMLSMGGFPPLIGFLSKLLVIQFLIMKEEYFITMFIVLTSMLVMAFYMRIAFTSMMNFLSIKKWQMYSNNTFLFILSTNMILTPLVISLTSIF